jgi:hypothetical protein
MAIYNKKVKDKEKGFKQQYKSEIMGNLDDQFLQAGYTKDKNGRWTKPASISDVPFLDKAIGWIPGATDFANRAISAGEKVYNKPNLENIMNAGQTLADSAMSGYNMGKQLADPKKLIKDIAIQQGKKALGMGLPKDYNKIDNHYNSWKMKGRGAGGAPKRKPLINVVEDVEETTEPKETEPNEKQNETKDTINEDEDEDLDALLSNEKSTPFDPKIWNSDNNDEEIKEVRKTINKKTVITGTDFEDFLEKSTNETKEDTIFLPTGKESVVNKNIKQKQFQKVGLVVSDSDNVEDNAIAKKYFPIDGVKMKIVNTVNKNGKTAVNVEFEMEEIKQYANTTGDISNVIPFQGDMKNKNSKPIMTKQERDAFEKEMKDVGISDDVIKRTLYIKPTLQNNKFQGNKHGTIKNVNDEWIVKRPTKDMDGTTKYKEIDIVVGKKTIPIQSIKKYNLTTFKPDGSIETKDMKKIADKICTKDANGFYTVKPERYLTELKPKMRDFKGKKDLYQKALNTYSMAYGFWLSQNDPQGIHTCYLSDSD